MISLSGYIQRVTYHNESNQYTIARFHSENTRSDITITGYLGNISTGEKLKLKGSWENHKKYGPQFSVEFFETLFPSSKKGIEKYLQSGIIKGIGPVMARKLVDCFEDETLDVIENNPDRLKEVTGLGKVKIQMIKDAWKEHHALRILMEFLQENGLKTSYCQKIFSVYGVDSVTILENNPYQAVYDIPVSGFLIADAISRKKGIPSDNNDRIKACILFLLNRTLSDGHLFSYVENLLYKLSQDFDVDFEKGEESIEKLSNEGEVVIDTDGDNEDLKIIFLKQFYDAEVEIAKRIKAHLSVPVNLPAISSDEIINEILSRLAINLSKEQLKVVEKVIFERVAIISGGPGTGKTTLIRSVNSILQSMDKKVILAAPTGRAARRLSEVTGRKASTIHKLLGYNFEEGSFEKNEDNPLEAYAIIIDEVSMVDALLMNNLLKAVPMTSLLILVGDVFQLPSVGAGNVLSDMIDSDLIPVFFLNKIYRQAKESRIILNAHKVRKGETPELKFSGGKKELTDFYFIEISDPEKTVSTVKELCTKSVPDRFGFDSVNDIQVLTPMHKGSAGTINLNQVLQSSLNERSDFVESMGNKYGVGDKVMHLKNNYEKDVYNGDIGVVREINKSDKEVTVEYYGRQVLYESEELEELSLAYAISIHKSQGSEYPVVIIPLTTHHFPLLQRNLLYTAITRGRELVIITGSKKALKISLDNDKPQNRLSKLSSRLRG